MSYYDVDAILTDAQKLPCTFGLDVPGLGYLDGNPGSTMKTGSKIDLPLWLGVMLAVSNSQSNEPLLTLEYPSALQQRVINAMKADPKSVDIRAQAPHFYALAFRVLEIFEDDDVVATLSETFRARAAEIADHAHNVRGGLAEGQTFLASLDELERSLYRAAHDGRKAVRAWETSLKKS
ncbi:hypothetical protein BT93_L1493 [Corymbia citriodora subsp. variegata]|uniref:DNA replication complex GINS protein PSF3 n=1 Tax=Corymbia citriodora subsp. variegata TaxID=360336 RepID=A0A8T0CIG1_CORYI|nr:hypothetical protein BT93_L1493 [Corymbia citriodora subsp. variegata]